MVLLGLWQFRINVMSLEKFGKLFQFYSLGEKFKFLLGSWEECMLISKRKNCLMEQWENI